MSIKPKYVKPILDRTKTYEFRKSIFARSDIDRIVIYSSSPRMRIVGYFKYKKILKENPKKLWEITKHSAGIDKKNFFKYFHDKEFGYAIKIEEVVQFKEEIDPRAIKPEFHAPQSYSYLRPGDAIFNFLKNHN